MAELAASIIGITTFGAQIGNQVYKLRALYKEFSSAPADIEFLLLECDRLDRVVDELKSQGNLIAGLGFSNSVFDQCCASCRAVLDVLDGIARDLESRRSKSRIKGSFTTLLRKDELSKHRDRLTTAKEDVIMAKSILDRLVHA